MKICSRQKGHKEELMEMIGAAQEAPFWKKYRDREILLCLRR